MIFCQSMTDNIGVPMLLVNRLSYIGSYENADMKTLTKATTTLAERMKLARAHAQLTQVQLARKTGIKQPTISDLESGKQKKSAYTTQIAHACGVSPFWLATGRGDMGATEDEEEMPLSDDEVRLLGMFRGLPQDFQHHIITNAVQIFEMFSELPEAAKNAFKEPGRSDEKVEGFADKNGKRPSNES